MESKLNTLQDENPWYQNGLRFKCTGCGKCCTGSPGYVWLSKEEMQAIANHLNITIERFMRTYIRQKEGRYSLIEKPSLNFDCVFLKGTRCSIYEVRPQQCRTYPWWIGNLKSKECWEEAAKICEGITEDAPLVSLEEIEKNL